MNADTLARQNQAQIAIIGAMLIDESCIGKVLSNVTIQDFPTGACRTTFKAISKLFSSRRPTDILTVMDTLGGGERLMEFVKNAMDVTPSCANVLEYCEILKQTTKLVKMADLAQGLQTVTTMEDAMPIISALGELLVDNRIQTLSMMDMAMEFWERMHSEKKVKYITTGLPTLDQGTYIELGDMVAIGAWSSTGKTAFAIQWGMHLAKEYTVGFYSFETGPKKIADRLMANQSKLVALADIKAQRLSPDQDEELQATLGVVADLPFSFVGAYGMTADEVVAHAVAHRYQVIFVDYIQLVADGIKSGTRNDVVAQISRTLHIAAQRHGILVIPLSQLSRPEKVDGKTKTPTMHSFRESGQIEQDVDVALLLYLTDPNNYRSNRILKIGKNKEGLRAEVELTFDGGHQRFAEAPKNVAGEYAEKGKQARRRPKPVAEQLPMTMGVEF